MSPPKAHIDVYARVRPVKRPSSHLEINYADSSIAIHMAKDKEGGLVNNQREDYNFAFTRILDATTTQDQAFDVIAAPVVDSVLEGYNGTIFAYGQTGSGKTFTITGGAERYADRGIIPRALSYVFAKLAEQPGIEFEVRISYLEIYNEAGYDLLDPSHETKGLEDLPKVSLQEDHDGKIHVRNLSAQLARNEEEALNLLFVGDTNRMISETPMNMASSRSHCIFTVAIEALRRARTWCGGRSCTWSTSPALSASRRPESRAPSSARRGTSTSRFTTSSRSSLRCRRKSSYPTETR